jgi:hypothetical protein
VCIKLCISDTSKMSVMNIFSVLVKRNLSNIYFIAVLEFYAPFMKH